MSAGADGTMPAGTRAGTPQVLLGHHLKQLKLPTILREYDKVARECAQGGVDHPGYLLRLLELELIDRERRVVDPPGVAYVYAPDRKADRPIDHLAGFRGILQTDGYKGYRKLAQSGPVRLAFCWAHVRRRFVELAQAGPAPIATEALARIAALYRIEAEIRGRAPEERRMIRQARSRPIIDALEPWLRERLALISQKSKLAEAIRYPLAHWAGLGLFLDDGRVEIDSNTVERSIRPLALTRKNALFAGSDGGAEHWAVVASLVETCKLIGVEPLAYLTDVITRIVDGHPNSRLDELLPWAYPTTSNLRAVA